MIVDKTKLGSRYTCFQCGTKFYDLNREPALCPECSADQAEAPARDIRSLLSGRGRPLPSSISSVPTSIDVDKDDDDDDFDDVDVDDDDDDSGDGDDDE